MEEKYLNKFTVIDTKEFKDKEKSENERIEQLYWGAFIRQLSPLVGQNTWTENRDNIKRAVFYAVKYYGLKSVIHKHSSELQTYKDVQDDFTFLECVKSIMARLTPLELMQIFPIRKTYDGDKWQCKDYFYTIEELKKYSMDEPLGIDGLEDFLWDYWNKDLFEFSSTAFSIISNMYRVQNGGKSIMEQWAEKQGIDTYTTNKKAGYMINNSTGEIHKLKKESKFEIVK